MKLNLQSKILIVFSTILYVVMPAQVPQIPFINQTTLLTTPTFHSGNAVGVCDMNNDGKDDIIRAAQNATMYIEYQNAPNAPFSEASFTNTFGSPWGMCTGDFDNNGFNDVMWGSGSTCRVLSADATGSSYHTTNVTALTGDGNVFTQGCNFIDIDNDGKMELVTGKRYRAHNGNDPGSNDPMELCYFKWNGESFTKNVISNGVFGKGKGTGLFFSVTDLHNTGRKDLILAGKDGLYVFFNDGL